MSVPILPGRPNHQVEQLAAVNLRLTGHGRADARFDDQVAALAQARDEGLIGGIGLSNVSLEQLRHAAHGTDVVCVQRHGLDRPPTREPGRRGRAAGP